MKKEYIAPEFEVIRFNLSDAILSSQIEDTIPSQYSSENGDELDIGL